MTAEMCMTLTKLGDKKSFENIISLLLYGIQNKIELYIKNPTQHNYFLIQNYIIFFMIITINLKSCPSFIRCVFEGKTQFFENLVEAIKKLTKQKKRDELFSIVNYLFLEEYKTLYFRKGEEKDEGLEQIFIEKQLFFSSMNLEITSYDESTFKKIIDLLLKFDLSYDNFFKNNENQKIKDEDRPEYKLRIAQSIIRVAFSKEKANFTKEKYYEFTFLKKVIDKDMIETKERFGDEVKTLFRKEDLCDDIIKYMFFIFGNSMMIESFVKPVKKMLKKVGLNEDCPKLEENKVQRDITVEEYNILMDEINKGLTDTIPHVITILLKLLYNSIRKVFKIEENDYNPLYTALIFNFIISPRIQMLYSINPLNCKYIRTLNRLIRNTCYNCTFKEDELSKFNDSIEKNNEKFKKFIAEKIIAIKETDDQVKESLNNLFTEKYLTYPKFLFYVDSSLLCATIQGGEEKLIDFHELPSSNTK